MSKKISLVPRDEARAVDAERINTWLEARGDVQRLDADAFVLELSNADIASQAEIYTGHDGEPIHYVHLEIASAGAPYGSSLVTEVRKFCEELAREFDLVMKHGDGTKPVTRFFEDGGL